MRSSSRRGLRAPSGIALFLFVFVAGTLAASAQTPFVPYFNKNRIKFDHFKWHTYTTDHFEIYYYPEIEQHLERVASYAESAYQTVSADLKHDLAFKVPLILYKTASEFQQQNIEPGELPEGVLAFAEPYRDRMVLPIDEPSDALYRLITHELTHIFEFDIIPRTLLRRGLPLWVDEGLADYETAYWNPFDLMSVRDAAIADIVPPMSDFQGVAVRRRPPALQPRSRRLRVHRGAVGQGGAAPVPLRAPQERHRRRRQRLRGSLQAEARRVRRTVRQVPEGPLQAVPRQGAAAGLRPRSRPEARQDAIRLGHLDRAVPLRRPDRRHGGQPQGPGARHHPAVHEGQQGDPATSTGGFNTGFGYEYISTPGGFRGNAVPWMSWSPVGDRIAYFARKEKQKEVVLQNVVTKKIEKRFDDQDGRHGGVAGHQPRRQDGWRSPACATPPATSSRSTSRPARSRTSPTTPSATTARPGRPTASRSSTWRASAATTSCSASTSRPARRRSSPSGPTTTAARSSWTPTRWCSRRRRWIRISRSARRSRRTATSTTCGR